MSIPDVSVVMSVFNGAEKLGMTLASVLHQEHCHFEFIVVNDGSTDASGRLLDEWAARDSRLKIIHQTNTGLTRALIRGCGQARGEFIARQDVGDMSLAGRLQREMLALRNDPALAFVSCGTRCVEPDGAVLFESLGTGYAREPRDILDLSQTHGLLDGPSHHGSVMFRTQAYHAAGGYRAAFYFGQDWDLWYRLGQAGKFLFLPETLYQANFGLGDISTNQKPLQEELAILSLAALKARLDGESDQSVLERASMVRPERSSAGNKAASKRLGRAAYFLGECLRKNGNYPRALDYLLISVRNDPLNPRGWVRLSQALLSRTSADAKH